MGTLELINLDITYDNNVISNFSLKLNKGDNIAILGGTGAGKTTLANVLIGLKDYTGIYKINGVEIVSTNAYLVNKFVTKVNTDFSLNIKVIDYLFNAISFKKLDTTDEQKKINDVIKYFNINDLLDKKMVNLNIEHLNYVLIIASLLTGHEYIIIDNLLAYLNNKEIVLIYNYSHKHKLSIINFTTSLDNAQYSSYLLFLYNKEIAMEGPTAACLKEETLLKRLGYTLPFFIDLSTQLCYYEIIDNIYADKETLVDAIWK
jgi:putative ABC transport system ATP-binding protein